MQRARLWVWWQHEDVLKDNLVVSGFFLSPFRSRVNIAPRIPKSYFAVFIFTFIRLADTFIPSEE